MADYAIDLLDSVAVILTAETASGESLESLGSFFVKYTTTDTPPERGSIPSVLMVDMLPIIGTRITCDPCFTEKQYPIRFLLWGENAGNTTKKTTAQLIDIVEDLFINNNLGISENVSAPQKSYEITEAPPFQTPYNSGASLLITHTATDIREN